MRRLSSNVEASAPRRCEIGCRGLRRFLESSRAACVGIGRLRRMGVFLPKMSGFLHWCVAAWISTVFSLLPFAHNHIYDPLRDSVTNVPITWIAPNVNWSPRKPDHPGHACLGASVIDFHTARPAFMRSGQAFSHLAHSRLKLVARGPPLPICCCASSPSSDGFLLSALR